MKISGAESKVTHQCIMNQQLYRIQRAIDFTRALGYSRESFSGYNIIFSVQLLTLLCVS